MADAPDTDAWANVDRDEAIRQAEHFHAENLRNLRVIERLRAERDRLDRMLTRCDEARERVIAERDRFGRGVREFRDEVLRGTHSSWIPPAHYQKLFALLDTSDDREDR